MPRHKPARGKRSRAFKNEQSVGPQPKLHELVWRMEAPLADAIDLVEALRLLGDGLLERDGGEGSAVVSVVAAAQERLRSVKEMWQRLVQAKGRGA